MVKTTENGALVPPFLMKCYEMVDDESTDAMIAWSSNGESFLIHDVTQFGGELLPKYFKHNNFSSFVRQLNIYGFRKVDTDRWEFANDQFLKGQKHLLVNIGRRKNSQATGQRKSSQQKENNSETCVESKNDGLWKEVEILKSDKIALTQQLSKLRQHQESSQSKLVFLREQLKGMEKNQQQMLSFIVMAMQNPGFFVQVLQPTENSNWRVPEASKRGVLKQVTDDHGFEPVNGAIVKYQPSLSASSEPISTPASDPENSLLLGHFDEMHDTFVDIDIDSFMSRFMDEIPLPSENHGQHILPNPPGDGSDLGELLSSCPKTMEDGAYDTVDFLDSGTGFEFATNGGQVQAYDTFELTSETPNGFTSETPNGLENN